MSPALQKLSPMVNDNDYLRPICVNCAMGNSVFACLVGGFNPKWLFLCSGSFHPLSEDDD